MAYFARVLPSLFACSHSLSPCALRSSSLFKKKWRRNTRAISTPPLPSPPSFLYPPPRLPLALCLWHFWHSYCIPRAFCVCFFCAFSLLIRNDSDSPRPASSRVLPYRVSSRLLVVVVVIAVKCSPIKCNLFANVSICAIATSSSLPPPAPAAALLVIHCESMFNVERVKIFKWK